MRYISRNHKANIKLHWDLKLFECSGIIHNDVVQMKCDRLVMAESAAIDFQLAG